MSIFESLFDQLKAVDSKERTLRIQWECNYLFQLITMHLPDKADTEDLICILTSLLPAATNAEYISLAGNLVSLAGKTSGGGSFRLNTLAVACYALAQNTPIDKNNVETLNAINNKFDLYNSVNLKIRKWFIDHFPYTDTPNFQDTIYDTVEYFIKTHWNLAPLCKHLQMLVADPMLSSLCKETINRVYENNKPKVGILWQAYYFCLEVCFGGSIRTIHNICADLLKKYENQEDDYEMETPDTLSKMIPKESFLKTSSKEIFDPLFKPSEPSSSKIPVSASQRSETPNFRPNP